MNRFTSSRHRDPLDFLKAWRLLTRLLNSPTFVCIYIYICVCVYVCKIIAFKSFSVHGDPCTRPRSIPEGPSSGDSSGSACDLSSPQQPLPVSQKRTRERPAFYDHVDVEITGVLQSHFAVVARPPHFLSLA